ncbi:uncharacterized protein LOC143860786 isoform X2 [Tasmannia lanceolata]|uniref:uncharacterized protein LOC143860786 isoform X2 n=1 Tax=Tasmannia lanceolata TaxID=3420 RepID=UPI004062C4D7
MGKNQAYKAMQRARVGSSSGGPDEIEDGMMDGSFHSPEWHAARLASLNTSHTVTWEEYKKKQKEDELKKGELEADKDKMMREYRAQLDAERASKLALGRNYSGKKSNHKKERKEKDFKKRSSKKRKGRHYGSYYHMPLSGLFGRKGTTGYLKERRKEWTVFVSSSKWNLSDGLKRREVPPTVLAKYYVTGQQ